MPNSPIILALLGFTLSACLLAFLKGEAAERIGALVILANMVLALAGEHFFPQTILLWLDALTALALLVVALVYASPWLGGVMLLYGAQFTLHAYYFVAARPRDNFHAVVNNVDFFLISLCLMIGTAVTWRRRARGLAPV